MKSALTIGILGIGISAAMLALGYQAGMGAMTAAAPADAPARLDRPAIESVVRTYLLENPELLIEVQTALEGRREAVERQAKAETIRQFSSEIFNADYDGAFGNPDGSVTIVEFFDYNCGYCKRALADMQALVADDPDLRFVLKEFPILGPDSQAAHIVSMAFKALAPERYEDFHLALMQAPGRVGEQEALDLALSLGANEAALRTEMANPAIERAFATTIAIATQLDISGTPSYVVGEEIVFGARGQQLLAEKIADARD